MVEFFIADKEEHFVAAATLFKEYAEWLAIDLCFQNFEDELLHLDKMYVPPFGGLVLSRDNDLYIGCVGIRRFSDDVAEMKRLYVKPGYRNKGIATRLLIEAEKVAKACSYNSIKLDTLDTMIPAITLYEANGYKRTSPYYHNPQQGAVYFEKSLKHHHTE